MAFLYRAEIERGKAWKKFFATHASDLEFRIWPELGDPNEIEFLAIWEPDDELFRSLPNLQVLFSTGAGVDQFDLSRIPQHIQVVRLIDPAIVSGVCEYVALATLLLHRRILDYQDAQQQGLWRPVKVSSAWQRRVGIMGLGSLGEAVVAPLLALGFSVRGWSRTKRDIDGVRCFSGASQLDEFLSQSEILICLLPLTERTRGILDRKLFDALPNGAGLVNVGRGAHLNEADLLSALSDGRMSGAVLDVLQSEPPPKNHPFWKHRRILLTPHIAGETGFESAAKALFDNIERYRAGKPMVGLIDRGRGY